MSRNCPICNSKENEFLYKQSFFPNNYCLVNIYNVVCCKNCGFVFASGEFTQEKANNYYKEYSKYEFKTSEKQKQYCKELFDFIFPWIQEWNSTILDIGCSNGDLLNEFKKKEFNVYGIEPSPFCASFAKNNFDIDVLPKSIFEFDTNEKFDFIILSAVLEHIVDLQSIVEKLKSLLTHNGRLFIEVPNILEFEKYIDVPFQQFSTEHLQYYSIRSICNLLSKYFIPIRVEASIHKPNNIVEPSLLLIFQKTNKSQSIKKDTLSEKAIKEYIIKSQQLEDKLKLDIEKRIGNEKEFIVWGCGTQLLHLIDKGIDFDKIVYFVDSNPRYQGKKIAGKNIYSPAEIKDNLPIFISSWSYRDQIEKQIREELKLENKIL